MAWKRVGWLVVLSALLGVACGGATRVHDGEGLGGAFGARETGGSSSWGSGGSFAGGAAGSMPFSGSGGTGGQGFLVPPEPTGQPPEPCASGRQAQVQFSTGSDVDGGARDGGATDSGSTEAGTPVDAGAIPCFVNIPDYPPGDVLDPNGVNVSVVSDGFNRVAYYVSDAAKCLPMTPLAFEWYYDDPVRPARISFCADTCAEFYRRGIDVVYIVRGCGGPRPVL